MIRALVEAFIQVYKILLGWCIVLPSLPFIGFIYLYKQCVVLIARIQGLVVIESCATFAAVEKVALNDNVEHEHERKLVGNLGFYVDLGEGNMDMNELIQKIQTSLIDKKRVTGYKLRSYWVRFGGYTFWRLIPDFKTSDYVHKVKLPLGEDILKFLNIWMTEPYKPKSAMWNVLVVDADCTEYLAIKIVHGLGDGLAVNEFANSIFDTQYPPQVQQLFKRTLRGVRILKMIHAFVEAPAVIWEELAKLKTFTVPFQITQGVELEQFSSTQSFNICDIKSIAKKQGVSFVAVLLTIYGNAVGKYLTNNRDTSVDNLVVNVAQPWPGRPKNFIGNQYNLMVLVVPVNDKSSLESLGRVQAQITHFYSSRKFIIMKYVVAKIHSIFPSLILRSTLPATVSRCALSPIVGLNNCTYNGRLVRSVAPLTGTCTTELGIFSVPFSQKDKLSWLVVGLKEVFKTQDNLDLLMQKYMNEEFDKLLQESNKKEFISTRAS